VLKNELYKESMELPRDLRHLFLQWIQTEYQTASQAKSRMAHTYYNAMKSLKQFPTSIEHPQQLIDLKYFGEKLVNEMTTKLKAYCDEYGYDFPEIPESMKQKEREKKQKDKEKAERIAKRRNKTNETENKNKDNDHNDANDDDDDDDDDESNKKTKKRKIANPKKYVPTIHSGGYGIMLALFIHDKSNRGMSKSDIIKYATLYCNSSFQSNPATGSFYSAWSSVKTLINKEYVTVEGTPQYYLLTDEGKEVAKVLNELNENAPRTELTVSRSLTEPMPKNNNSSFLQQNRSFSFNAENDRLNPLDTSSPMLSKLKNKKTSLKKINKILSSSPFKNGILDENKQRKQSLNTSSPLRMVSTLTENINSANRSEYQIWKEGTYKIKFVLDNREVFSKQERDFFSKTLKDKGIPLDVRSLPVGDGIWIAVNRQTKQESTLDFIFERKRLDDLAGSITDGRFREQKSRLQRTGMRNIFYIVEEQMGSDISKFSEAIKTCISMNTTYSGFHTIRTKDPDKTMTLICDLTELINKMYSNESLLVLEPRNLKTQQQYTQLIRNMKENHDDKEVVYSYHTFNEIMGKSSMTSVGEIFVRLLMTLRGVGLDKACAIQQYFKTPRYLLEKYEKVHPKCDEFIFKTLADEIGTRKIGKALSAKLALVWCQQCNKNNNKN
jgi:crossover junction endonuclease MUS81